MMKNKIIIILGIATSIAFYLLGKKDGEIQGLKNENLNNKDLIRGQRETIDMLNYALGKRSII